MQTYIRLAIAASLLGGCFQLMPSHGAGTDNKPLPAHEPSLVNGDGEKVLWTAAQEWAPLVGKPAPTILRAYIVNDRDWIVDRNERTGIITDRFMHAAVMYKGGQTGKCRQWLCNLIQPETGGNTYGKPYLACPNGLTVALTCESIEPLRPSPPQ
jgi:hypothetical protein